MRAYLKFSSGVVVPKTVIIAAAFVNACNEMALNGEYWVTSGNDRVHAPNSAHYTDEALDFRSKTMTPADKQRMVTVLSRRLGPDYVVILEDEGGLNEHLHVQVRRERRRGGPTSIA